MTKLTTVLLLLLLILLTVPAVALEKTICGDTDDRVWSSDPKIGRAVKKIDHNGGCTLTMIGRQCAISAGHCKNVLHFAEFNVPRSINFDAQHPGEEDIYQIDQDSIVYNNRFGSDYAVFKLLPNKQTGAYAGDRYGHYEVATKKPSKGQIVKIIGYGVDSDGTDHVTQQINLGEITDVGTFRSLLYHRADTRDGNSGSAIILEENNQIVGIHTNGGCRPSGGENRGTLIAKNKNLKKAIQSCLGVQ
ncbi:MAG: trypsin-like serine protease [Bdellovibrionales bacterium]|nr:trypsin-like serine protease [Bdellovibrionales bacterium]